MGYYVIDPGDFNEHGHFGATLKCGTETACSRNGFWDRY